MGNKNYVQKCISMAGASLMVGMLFAGCGSADSSRKADSQAATKTEQAGVKSEKVEVEFFQQKPEAVDTYNSIIAEFEKKNPNIKIAQNNVPDPNKVLATRMASGNTPDVFSVYPNAAEYKVYVSQGFLLDITGKEFLKNVKQDILNSIKVDSKDYSLPISVNTTGVFYNTKIFKQLGIEVPKTYAGFIEACKKAKSAGITPIALADKENWTVGISTTMMTGSELGKDAASFFESLEKGRASSKDNKKFSEIAQRLLDLRQYGQNDPVFYGYNEAINMFANEKSVMFINGIWAIPSVTKANPNLEFNIFPLPAANAADTRIVYGIDVAVSISANVKNQDAALKFLEHLASTGTAQYFSDKDNSPSCINGVQVKSDKIKSLTELIDKGNAFEWLHFKWANGMEDKWNTAAQTLVVKKDIDGYFKEIDRIFKESKKQ